MVLIGDWHLKLNGYSKASLINTITSFMITFNAFLTFASLKSAVAILTLTLLEALAPMSTGEQQQSRLPVCALPPWRRLSGTGGVIKGRQAAGGSNT